MLLTAIFSNWHNSMLFSVPFFSGIILLFQLFNFSICIFSFFSIFCFHTLWISILLALLVWNVSNFLLLIFANEEGQASKTDLSVNKPLLLSFVNFVISFFNFLQNELNFGEFLPLFFFVWRKSPNCCNPSICCSATFVFHVRKDE